ncbi:MAG: class I SAM-dependent methyltransferase, partial [Pseudomonadota bacterium]
MSDISQSELWNGEMGERWAAYSDALDHMLSPFIEPIMTAAALQPGERVVDIGCGAGVLSVRAAADVAPMGQVVGVDVSRPIVDVAEARFGERGDVAFEVTDASVWKPADLFDVLISRFGVMFFEDPVGGFQNLRAAIKPGGRMAFACWRTLPENDWAFALMKAVLPAIG